MDLAIDKQRLSAELDTLGAISEAPAPVVTRVVFTEADLRARAYVKQLCTEAELTIREDAVGNTFARWSGTDNSLAPVGTGSHIDAIPNAGRFDGTVGVLGAIEAMRALKRGGFHPRRPIELLIFTAEEPTRFGVGCLGSRFLAGLMDESEGERLKDRAGVTLNQARSAAGFHGDLASVQLPSGYYSAFVELHIEQGPLLERHQNDIGIVTAIAAPASLRIWIEGEGGHAGAVLMRDRRDAFAAAAEIVLAVEHAANSSGSEDTVGTVGVCEVFPGAINSIPSRVKLEVDIRDIDGERRDAVLRRVELALDEIGQRRAVQIRTERINADPPAKCDPSIVQTIIDSAQTHGLRFETMISRAYHDSLFMSRVVPTAMLFVPCRGGLSHSPDEYSSPEAIAGGALVLAETMARLGC